MKRAEKKEKNKRKYENVPSASFFNEQGKPLLDALVKESERGQVLIAAHSMGSSRRRIRSGYLDYPRNAWCMIIRYKFHQ